MSDSVLGGWCRGLLMANCLLIAAATLYSFVLSKPAPPLPTYSPPAPHLVDWPKTKHTRAHA